MVLFLIGLGLADISDVTLKGFELIKKASKVYLEGYTLILQKPIEELEKFYGKKITLLDRKGVEQDAEETFLAEAQKEAIALLVVGDPLTATTHTDIIDRASQLGIKTVIVHNASILSAVGSTGLQVYKFGKTTSIPFPEVGFEPESPYLILKENKSINAHTLFLLDLRPSEGRFMSIPTAINYLLKIEQNKKEGLITPETKAIACARLGSQDQRISYGPLQYLAQLDYGKAPFCLIIPGPLHFMEEKMLEKFT